MAKENMFMKSLQEQGLIDDRHVAVMAVIMCTNGMRGRAWVFLNGTSLAIYEPSGFSGIGEWIDTIDLTQAKFLKGSSFVFSPSMKLEYSNDTYTFTRFNQAKNFIDCIKASCGS